MTRKIAAAFGLMTTIVFGSVSQPAAADPVAATASVYGSGDGSTTPNTIALLPTSRYLTFGVSDSISFNGGGNYNDADGVGSASSTNITGINGLSGISAYDAGYLTGVFLNAAGTTTVTPASLSYASSAATAFTSVSPLLNQVFFIGDGLTGDGTGMLQQFFVPTGAIRLVLGFADAPGYNGAPGSYGDNVGSLAVTSNIISAAGVTGAVPEPATWAMVILGFGVVGAAMRRRKNATAQVSYAV